MSAAFNEILTKCMIKITKDFCGQNYYENVSIVELETASFHEKKFLDLSIKLCTIFPKNQVLNILKTIQSNQDKTIRDLPSDLMQQLVLLLNPEIYQSYLKEAGISSRCNAFTSSGFKLPCKFYFTRVYFWFTVRS